jgi:hypothetical protein
MVSPASDVRSSYPFQLLAQKPEPTNPNNPGEIFYRFLSKVFKFTPVETPRDFTQTEYYKTRKADQQTPKTPTKGAIPYPSALTSLTDEEKAIVKKFMGGDIDGYSLPDVVAKLDYLLQIAVLNPGGAGSTIEQLQAARTVVIRAMTVEVQNQTNAIRKLDLLYRDGMITADIYGLNLRAAMNELRALRNAMDVVNNQIAALSNQLGSSILEVDRDRLAINLKSLEEKIIAAEKIGQEQLSTIRINADTSALNVTAQTTAFNYLMQGWGQYAVDARGRAIGTVPGSAARNPYAVPNVLGSTVLSSDQQASLTQALFPATTANNQAQTTVPSDAGLGQYITPQIARNATLYQQQNIAQGLSTLRTLSNEQIQTRYGTSRANLESELIRLNITKPKTLNRSAYQQILSNRVPYKNLTQADFEKLKSQVEQDTKLSPAFVKFIKGLNQAQWQALVLTTVAIGSVGQLGKVGGGIGLIFGGVGAIPGYWAGKAIEGAINTVAGDAGYIPQSWASFSNSLGTYVRSNNLVLTEITRLQTIQSLSIQREQLVISQKQLAIRESSNNLSEVELIKSIEQTENQQQRLTQAREALTQRADQLDISVANRDLVQQSLRVDRQIQQNNLAVAQANRGQAETNRRIAETLNQQIPYNGNLNIVIRAGLDFNSEVSAIMVRNGIASDKFVAVTRNGLLISMANLEAARRELSEAGAQGASILTGTTQSDQSADNIIVLRRAAQLTEQQFAQKYSEAWRILNFQDGNNVVGRLGTEFLLTGRLRNVEKYSPFNTSEPPSSLPDNYRLSDPKIVWRYQSTSPDLLGPRPTNDLTPGL